MSSIISLNKTMQTYDATLTIKCIDELLNHFRPYHSKKNHCDICMNKLDINQKVLHCLIDNKIHPNGYITCKQCSVWYQNELRVLKQYQNDAEILDQCGTDNINIGYYNQYPFTSYQFTEISINIENEETNKATLNYLISNKNIINMLKSPTTKTKCNQLYISRYCTFNNNSINLIQYVSQYITEVWANISMQSKMTKAFINTITELSKYRTRKYSLQIRETRSVELSQLRIQYFNELLTSILDASYHKTPNIELVIGIPETLFTYWAQNKTAFNELNASISNTCSVWNIRFNVAYIHNEQSIYLLCDMLKSMAKNKCISGMNINFSGCEQVTDGTLIKLIQNQFWNNLISLIKNKQNFITDFNISASLYKTNTNIFHITKLMMDNLMIGLLDTEHLQKLSLDVNWFETPNFKLLCKLFSKKSDLTKFQFFGKTAVENKEMCNILLNKCMNYPLKEFTFSMLDSPKDMNSLVNYIQSEKNGMIEYIDVYINDFNKMDGLLIIASFFKYLLNLSVSYLSIDIYCDFPELVINIIKQYSMNNELIVYVAENALMRTFLYDEEQNELKMYQQFMKNEIHKFIQLFNQFKNKSVNNKNDINNDIKKKSLLQMLTAYKYCICQIFKTMPIIHIEGINMMSNQT
eukprot:332339_1